MYFNLYEKIVSSAPAATSFSTALVWPQHDGGFFQVNWTSFASTGAYFSILGSGDNGNNFNTLVNNAGASMTVTIGAAAGSQGFDLEYFGGTHLKVVYAANGTTGAGTVEVHKTIKGRR